jgi:hypothetical protein
LQLNNKQDAQNRQKKVAIPFDPKDIRDCNAARSASVEGEVQKCDGLECCCCCLGKREEEGGWGQSGAGGVVLVWSCVVLEEQQSGRATAGFVSQQQTRQSLTNGAIAKYGIEIVFRRLGCLRILAFFSVDGVDRLVLVAVCD